MMGEAAMLACDWGTTNLRAWVLDHSGAVLAKREFPLGIGRLGAGQAAARFEAEVRPSLDAQGLPAMLCGMVGSQLGWMAVPYVDCPANLADLVEKLTVADDLVRIVPGLKGPGVAAAPDVMRGEETQVFGWLAQYPERQTGRQLLGHPGTHSKWILIEDGRVVRFVTAMTGELFAVLSQHSLLRSDAAADDDEAFELGLAAAGAGDALAARLFSARARVVGGGSRPESTPSYLSGVLIGAEVAAVPRLLGDLPAALSLLGDGALCRRYQRAFARTGLEVDVYDGEAAAIAGLFALGNPT